ncbi:MAG: SDR family NAD(P)-dependent oxidoreductase, partial [Pseudomonadales bacterium]|nr:SDR family NAD(P)-dependent oxidoreductase [Pseudomonadales bacterium]
MKKKLKITDKTIWVTGASSGIGLALVQQLASAGNHIYASSRDTVALSALSRQYTDIIALPCDVTDNHSVTNAVAVIRKNSPSLDMVITCAGICHYFDKGDIDCEQAQKLINTNFMGTVRCIQAALPLIRRENHLPQIVALSSLSADVAFPRASIYGASKVAVNYFIRSLRSDLANSGIRPGLVHPGFI